jgi:hypothetical protein
MYCRVKYLSTDVSEVRAASIIRAMTRQYIPEDKSELRTKKYLVKGAISINQTVGDEADDTN